MVIDFADCIIGLQQQLSEELFTSKIAHVTITLVLLLVKINKIAVYNIEVLFSRQPVS